MKQLIVFFALGMFLAVTCNAQMETGEKRMKKGKKKGYQIGSTVEDFSLKGTDGNIYSLASMNDAKGYIVIFTSNLCPFAVGSEDRMVDLQNQVSQKGYQVVAINSNQGEEENLEAMAVRAEEKGYPFVYLKDDQSVYAKFGANKTPHAFLLDSDMKVRYIGSIDDDPRDASQVEETFLMDAINALERGETPDPETTKAIGCPIKAKGMAGGKKGGRKGPPSAAELMERMDENGDGKISTAEAHGPLAKKFDSMDANSDGLLDAVELESKKKGKK